MQTITNNAAATVAASALPPGRTGQVERTKPQAEKTAAEREIDVSQAAQRVEKFVQTMSSDLQFSIDASSGDTVVRVIDRATKEVIRQIPSEEMLVIARALERMQGLLIRQKA